MAVSLIISTNKPVSILGYFEKYIQKNKSINEVILIGPRQKNEKLIVKKINYKFIKSLKKPSECLDYAIKFSSNKMFVSIPDDVTFDTDDCFDQLYELKINYPNTIFSTRYFINNENFTKDLVLDSELNLKPEYKDLIIPLCPIINKSDYYAVGGIDTNLIHSYWDVDLILRILQLKKYKVKMTLIGLIEKKDSSATLHSNYGLIDKEYFYNKWFQELSINDISKKTINNKFILHKWYIEIGFIQKILSFRIFELIINKLNNTLMRI